MSEINEKKKPLNKNNKVPKLRLSRYNDEPLMTKKLGSIVSFSKGSGLSKDDLKDCGHSCILYGELYTKYLGKIDEIYSKTSVVPYNPKYSKAGDIIMPLSGETPLDISNSAVVPKDGVILGSDLLVLTPKLGFNSLFLSYYISNCKKIEIAKKACGISIIHSHKHDIENLIVNYPSSKEQDDISQIVSRLDKKIILINNKITTLKKYKEGLAKEAIRETINYWKNGVGNAKELSNYIIEKKEYSEKDGNYPHVTLSTEGISDKSDRYDRDFLVKDNNKKYKVTRFNQLCYNPANLKFGVICINRYGDGIFSPIYVTFEVKNIELEYLELIVTSADFNRYSMLYQQGTVYERMSVSPEDFCKIKLVVNDKHKQKGIALTASVLNKKISKLESELENLKLIKTNLLNNMFI